MNTKLLIVGLFPLALIASAFSYAADDAAKKPIETPGHTSDMQGRESHSPEHMKKKHQHMGRKPVQSTDHGSKMQGREGHSGPGTAPVTEGGMTTDMPGREGHSDAHNKK